MTPDDRTSAADRTAGTPTAPGDDTIPCRNGQQDSPTSPALPDSIALDVALLHAWSERLSTP